jgi:hypothetical protein
VCIVLFCGGGTKTFGFFFAQKAQDVCWEVVGQAGGRVKAPRQEKMAKIMDCVQITQYKRILGSIILCFSMQFTTTMPFIFSNCM